MTDETPLTQQHAEERTIMGDSCPADLLAFARKVAAMAWAYGRAKVDVVAEAQAMVLEAEWGARAPAPTADPRAERAARAKREGWRVELAAFESILVAA